MTVNMAADGQVIGVEELKRRIFWLEDTTHGQSSLQPQGRSIVNESRLLYDLNFNHQPCFLHCMLLGRPDVRVFA